MNERIRELVVESGNGLMRDGRLYPHIGSRTEADLEKFAELIVRECAEVIHKRVGPKSALDVLQHFGVEE